MRKSQFISLTQSTDQINQQQQQQNPVTPPSIPQPPSSSSQQQQQQQKMQQQQQKNSSNIGKTNYCLLIKDSIGDDKSFTLKTIQSNCSESLEFNIKSFIYQKITKNMIYKSGSFGIIESSSNNNQDILNNNDESLNNNNNNNNINDNINDTTTTATTTNNTSSNNNPNTNNNSSSSSSPNNNKSNPFILSCFYTLIEVPIKQQQQQQQDNNIVIPVDTNNNSLIDDELILKNNKFQDELENLDNLVDFSINDDLDDIVNDVLEGNPSVPITNIKKKVEFTKEYYLCLVCETQSDVNFGMFHLELTEFCSSLNCGLVKDYTNNSNNINISGSGSSSSSISLGIQNKLSNWYSTCIDYISRSIKILDSSVSFIIYAILSGNTFKIKGSKSIVDDIISFLKTISIVNLSTIELSQNEFLIKPDEQQPQQNNNEINNNNNNDDNINTNENNNNDRIFSIEIVEEESNEINNNNNNNNNNNIKIILNKKIDNLFCRKWSSKYLENSNNSIILRNLSEEMKLRVIQEFNMFRRMIDLSTLNNYLLYKSFLFLKCSDNSDILLYLLKKDNIKDIQEILSVLELQLEQHQSTNYK